ncbi:endonuclease domain-containing protein [Microbacterium sp. 77mftsu3.1]|uniref:endonuclease domain-containing protein n=1 Tax=Microbacterium sp. 77mftsu3.1 TaxID=1761802 RepID=UPI00210D814C|nr:type IV toxin-antitoxin system AbiEi family antitoxin domain-containing protein [Microbacterium sp. 77mftsu3.1]
MSRWISAVRGTGESSTPAAAVAPSTTSADERPRPAGLREGAVVCEDGAGLTTTAELRRSGLSPAAIAAAVRAGTITRMRRGTYAARGACVPVREAARHGGVLGCLSAARHRGLWTLEAGTDLHVWMRADGHRLPHDGCRCLDHWDAAPSAGRLAAASVPRILRQIWLCRGVEEFFVAVESALHLGMLTPAGRAWLRRTCGDGARVALDFAGSDSESGLESLLRWRLRGTGVSLRAQVDVAGVGRVDFLLGDRVILEADRAEHHASERARHRDLLRDANAAAWGYVTLRFDYAMIVHDWDTVRAAVDGLLASGIHRS